MSVHSIKYNAAGCYAIPNPLLIVEDNNKTELALTPTHRQSAAYIVKLHELRSLLLTANFWHPLLEFDRGRPSSVAGLHDSFLLGYQF